ncbi:uncharacterized protein [Eleutherodactylus coqui]|uniref:uncharacterized protein n=1 Tax=Eleutherodactylus coqui TaxID=57060 RepID=UPI0034619014
MDLQTFFFFLFFFRQEVNSNPPDLRQIEEMAWYQRMGINVSRMIMLVESKPQIWDTADEGYSDRDVKADAWLSVCSGMYPDWDTATAARQNEILKDVKNRWRSVRDRYKKHEKECEKSGSSPSKKKCPYAEELAFIRSGRQLRPTSGNVQPSQSASQETSEESGQQATQLSADIEINAGTPTLDDSRLSAPDSDPNCVSIEALGQTASASRPGTHREPSCEPAGRSVVTRGRKKKKSLMQPKKQWHCCAALTRKTNGIRWVRQWRHASVSYPQSVNGQYRQLFMLLWRSLRLHALSPTHARL